MSGHAKYCPAWDSYPCDCGHTDTPEAKMAEALAAAHAEGRAEGLREAAAEADRRAEAMPDVGDNSDGSAVALWDFAAWAREMAAGGGGER